MSVGLESTSVLVLVERIEERWPGGLAGYERDAPTGRFESDGELACVAFGSTREAQAFAWDLESSGFRFETPNWSDIALIEEDGTGAADCPWIELVFDEQGMAREASLIEDELPGPPEAWEV